MSSTRDNPKDQYGQKSAVGTHENKRVARQITVRTGPYELVMTGISPDRDLSSDALIFMRPYGALLAVLILGIILSAACLIGGLVFTALELAGR